MLCPLCNLEMKYHPEHLESKNGMTQIELPKWVCECGFEKVEAEK